MLSFFLLSTFWLLNKMFRFHDFEKNLAFQSDFQRTLNLAPNLHDKVARKKASKKLFSRQQQAGNPHNGAWQMNEPRMFKQVV